MNNGYLVLDDTCVLIYRNKYLMYSVFYSDFCYLCVRNDDKFQQYD